MSRLRWLTANATIDSDGVHVWVSHDCEDGPTETMLPNPPWHASADGRQIEPSVNCGVCGMHVFALITVPSCEEVPSA